MPTVSALSSADDLLARTYVFLTFLRGVTPPGFWSDKDIALYLEIEEHITAPRTGTIRDPRSPIEDVAERRRKRMRLVPPESA